MPETLQFLLSGFFLSFSFVVNYVPINILAMTCILYVVEHVSFLKSALLSTFIVIVSYSFIWFGEAFFSLYYPVSLAHVSSVVEHTHLLIYLICLHAVGYCGVQTYLLKICNKHISYERVLGISMTSNVIAVAVLLILYYKIL